MRPNICKCIRYIDLNDKTLLENTLGTLKKRNTPRRWCATRSEVALRVWRPAACLQAAQLAPKIYYNRPRSGPTEGQRQYGNGLFYSNATFETLFSLFGGQFTGEVTFIKAFFFRLCCGLFVFWLVESSHLQRHKLKDPTYLDCSINAMIMFRTGGHCWSPHWFILVTASKY